MNIEKNIVIKDLDISYGHNKVIINFNLTIKKGEIICLFGPNGCGKSTILNAIAGLIPYEGEITKNNLTVALVSQNPSEMILPWLTNEQNVFFPKNQSNVDQHILEELFNITNLESWRYNFPYQLSGGMAQMLLLARALIHQNDVIILDEPFKSLDFQMAQRMQETIRKVHRNYNPTIILVSHDVNEALFLADKIILLSERPTKIKKEIILSFERQRDNGMLNPEYFSHVRQEVLNEFLG